MRDWQHESGNTLFEVDYNGRLITFSVSDINMHLLCFDNAVGPIGADNESRHVYLPPAPPKRPLAMQLRGWIQDKELAEVLRAYLCDLLGVDDLAPS